MKKCLVIDDVEVSRFVASEFLAELGFEFAVAKDSEQALVALRRSRYDVVLLDWHIAKESGIELLKKIREEFGKALPVIMCSGVEKQQSKAMAMEAGANDFLEKPTTKEKLEDSFRKLGII
jgi:two-component system, chemotaxis family, chemotaxis protein CheY